MRNNLQGSVGKRTVRREICDKENLSGRKDRLLRRGGLLSRGGWLYFEVNERFAAEVAELMQVAGFSECTVVKDMFGKERMVKGTLC